MLYCLILGDALWNVFLVEVSRDKSVFDLRDTIKEKTGTRFANIPANNLKLWKVNISTKGRSLNTEIHAEDEDILKQLVDENELNPFQDVEDYFDDDELFLTENH